MMFKVSLSGQSQDYPVVLNQHKKIKGFLSTVVMSTKTSVGTEHITDWLICKTKATKVQKSETIAHI